MTALLAAVQNGADLGIVFVILALLAFGAAVYLAFHNQYVGAIVAAVVGVIIVAVT